jgi:hypothetical protein
LCNRNFAEETGQLPQRVEGLDSRFKAPVLGLRSEIDYTCHSSLAGRCQPQDDSRIYLARTSRFFDSVCDGRLKELAFRAMLWGEYWSCAAPGALCSTVE